MASPCAALPDAAAAWFRKVGLWVAANYGRGRKKYLANAHRWRSTPPAEAQVHAGQQLAVPRVLRQPLRPFGEVLASLRLGLPGRVLSRQQPPAGLAPATQLGTMCWLTERFDLMHALPAQQDEQHLVFCQMNAI